MTEPLNQPETPQNNESPTQRVNGFVERMHVSATEKYDGAMQFIKDHRALRDATLFSTGVALFITGNPLLMLAGKVLGGVAGYDFSYPHIEKSVAEATRIKAERQSRQ